MDGIAGARAGLNLAVLPVSPNGRQYAAGQRWVACAVVARVGTAGFLSSLRDTFPTRSAPPAFGVCSTADEPITQSNTPGTAGHVTELFATYAFDGTGATPPGPDRQLSRAGELADRDPEPGCCHRSRYRGPAVRAGGRSPGPE